MAMPDDEVWTKLAVPHRAVKSPHADTVLELGSVYIPSPFPHRQLVLLHNNTKAVLRIILAKVHAKY